MHARRRTDLCTHFGDAVRRHRRGSFSDGSMIAGSIGNNPMSFGDLCNAVYPMA
jgi:hypothetical protein